MSEAPPPRAFISYAWESEDHRLWVRSLAARLRTDGVDVTLDQWHLRPGDLLPRFMETAVRTNDFVIIVCTPKYKARSDDRLGGVGYEGDIMTGEVFNGGNRHKFVPVLRGSDAPKSCPSWLGGAVFVDLRGESYSEESYLLLLRTLHAMFEVAPPIGRRPPNLGSPHSASSDGFDVVIDVAESRFGIVARLSNNRGSSLHNVAFAAVIEAVQVDLEMSHMPSSPILIASIPEILGGGSSDVAYVVFVTNGRRSELKVEDRNGNPLFLRSAGCWQCKLAASVGGKQLSKIGRAHV